MPKNKKKQLAPLSFVRPDMKAIREAAKEHRSAFAHRHELLKRYQRINFKKEFDRLQGLIQHTNLPETSITRLTNRKTMLSDMIKSNAYPVRGPN